MHLLYRPPAPPVPQTMKSAEVDVELLDDEPESLELNEALREPVENELPVRIDEKHELPLRRRDERFEGFAALDQAAAEQRMSDSRPLQRPSWVDRREAAVQEPAFQESLLQEPAVREPLAEEDIPLTQRRVNITRPDIKIATGTYANIVAAVAHDQAPLSDQFHILGSDIRAKYLAYNLAGLPKVPPVQLLLNQKYDLDTWKEEGQAINLFRGERAATRNRIEASWIFDQSPWLPEAGRIDQLLVTIPCANTVHAITQIRDRIDHNTTICLIQEGLGVVEALNATVFRDVATRPHYVLGTLTHQLGYSKKGYTLSEMKPGHLALTAFDGKTSFEHMTCHPPIERQVRESYLLQLLTLDPELRAGGYRYSTFLRRKLPEMVFRSTVDTIVATLGISYDQILINSYANYLHNQLIKEIGNVVVALPEARNEPALLEYVESGKMSRHCKLRLKKSAKQRSRMANQVGKGLETEIDFLNGYFVRRGKALGIKSPSNDMIIGMLKAKQTLARTELEKRLPYVGYGPPKGWRQSYNGVKKMIPRTE